jgi:hypothetical protein
LGISRNTVRKYLRQDEVTTAHQPLCVNPMAFTYLD